MCVAENCPQSQLYWIGNCWPAITNIVANTGYTQFGTVFTQNPTGHFFPDQDIFGPNLAYIASGMLYFNGLTPIPVPTNSEIVYMDNDGMVYFNGSELIHLDLAGTPTDDYSLVYGGYTMKGSTITSGYTGVLTLLATDKKYFISNALVFVYQQNTIVIDENSTANIIRGTIQNYALRNGTAVVSFS